MSLRQTASCTTPSSDPDIAVEQLTRNLKAVLERHAPLKSRTRRVGSSDMRWMTPEAISARKERRRMERSYDRTKSDEDRKNFRVSCRKTDRLVREARSAHVRSEIIGVGQNPRLLWRSIRNLLHPGSGTDVWYQGLNTDNHVNDISLYFVNKLTKISETIADGLRLSALRLSASRSPTYIPASVGSTLDIFSTVTIAEVMKLIESAPEKNIAIRHLANIHHAGIQRGAIRHDYQCSQQLFSHSHVPTVHEERTVNTTTQETWT